MLSCITGESVPLPSAASEREQTETKRCLLSREKSIFKTGI